MSTPAMIAAQVAFVCDRAADEIERRGHVKGYLKHRVTGAVCALGALQAAVGDEPGVLKDYDRSSPFMMAVDAVSAHVGTSILPHWNNMPERRPEEVILAFRETARALRAEFRQKQIVIDRQTGPVQIKPLSTDPRVVIPAPARAHAKASL